MRTPPLGGERPGAGAIPLRPGVTVPDWSLVRDATAREALAASMAVAGRRERWADLAPEEDRLWQAVLRGFAARGGAPDPAALAAATGTGPAAVAARLRGLQARDLLVLDEAGAAVAAAYPFSARETPHRLRLGDGRGTAVFALCAIDALGAGGMLGLDAIVESRCARCGAPIRIATRGRGRALASVAPAGTVVWSGIRYAGGCAATSGCAVKPFFCSDDHLAAWRAASGHPPGAGFRLSVEAAQQAGLALFVPMLAPATA